METTVFFLIGISVLCFLSNRAAISLLEERVKKLEEDLRNASRL